MSHIFISYSREDYDYTRKLADHLMKAGFDVWIDDRIEVGDDWWDKIDVAINDCSAFIVVMSSSAKNSRWVKREVLLAEKRNKPAFPLLLQGEHWSIFVDTEYLDIRNKEMPPPEFEVNLSKIVPRTQQGRNIGFQIPEELVVDPFYTYLSREDVSHGTAKRYSADILTNPYYSKETLKKVIVRATSELRQSNFYRSKQAEDFYTDKPTDVVFLFVYLDLADRSSTNWVCRTLWINQDLPENSKPHMWKADEVIAEIRINWKSDYQSWRQYWTKNTGSKQDWIRKVDSILPKVAETLLQANTFLTEYENSGNQAELQKELEAIEKIAQGLYIQGQNQKLPPQDCAETDLKFQIMMGHFHNIFIPFANWGNVTRTWENKMWLLKRYFQYYEEAKGEFEYEWRKIRR